MTALEEAATFLSPAKLSTSPPKRRAIDHTCEWFFAYLKLFDFQVVRVATEVFFTVQKTSTVRHHFKRPVRAASVKEVNIVE